MPVTYWTDDEVEQQTRIVILRERQRCAGIVRAMQIKYASDACGWALDAISNPCEHGIEPYAICSVCLERRGMMDVPSGDEHSKFGF